MSRACASAARNSVIVKTSSLRVSGDTATVLIRNSIWTLETDCHARNLRIVPECRSAHGFALCLQCVQVQVGNAATIAMFFGG